MRLKLEYAALLALWLAALAVALLGAFRLP
jgi:hypothetical protein